jgi:hypothetical protein
MFLPLAFLLLMEIEYEIVMNWWVMECFVDGL